MPETRIGLQRFFLTNCRYAQGPCAVIGKGLPTCGDSLWSVKAGLP